MPGLDPLDRQLLDFLCSCAHHRVRVVRIKAPRAAALRRLHEAGHVGPGEFEPSPLAMLDWLGREEIKRLAGQPVRYETNETPARSRTPRPAEPPAPKAVARGGGVARYAGAPSPSRNGPPSMAERARRFEELRAAKTNKNIPGASGTTRKVSGAASSGAAKRITDRAPAMEPVSECPPVPAPVLVDIKVNALPNPGISGAALAAEIEVFMATTGMSATRFSKLALGRGSAVRELKSTKVPSPATIERVRAFMADPPPEALRPCRPGAPRGPRLRPATAAEAEHYRMINARRGDAVRRNMTEQAQARIDAGLPAGKAASANVRTRQVQLEEQLAESARLADPLEQAKTLLRRRYSPVVGAEISGGPKGKFYVGRRLVDEAELLAMAQRLAA